MNVVPVVLRLRTTLVPPLVAVGSMGRSRGSVATRIWYPAAALTADQVKAGAKETLVLLLTGVSKVGAGRVDGVSRVSSHSTPGWTCRRRLRARRRRVKLGPFSQP